MGDTVSSSFFLRAFDAVRRTIANNDKAIIKSVLFALNVYFFYSLKSILPTKKETRSTRSYFSFWRSKSVDNSGNSLTPEHMTAENALINKLRSLNLNYHEETIADGIISFLSSEIPGFSQIGGLEDTIKDLQDFVIYPLRYPHIFCNDVPSKDKTKSNGKRNSLLAPPRGVLFYGPPGCGKTMLARAIAKEANSTFINVNVSTLTEKWFGESQKLVNAIFTLARKMQPSIIFIDEIDSFLRSRRVSDHDALNMMKSEFLSLWDGLNSCDKDCIVVIGATNRPQDIDDAALRRMPRKYKIGYPNYNQRLEIFKVILSDANLVSDFNFEEVARITDGLTGSDVKELCRRASMLPVREMIKNSTIKIDELEQNMKNSGEEIVLRPLKNSDFVELSNSVFKNGENFNVEALD